MERLDREKVAEMERFDIFNVEKCRNLEIRVRGHSRSSKIIPSNPAPMSSY